MHELKTIALRLVEEPPLLSETPIESAETAVRVVGERLKEYAREVVCMICLDAKLRPLNMSIVSMGALTTSIVDPKEIYKTALLCNASSIVLLHNHPTGLLEPSREDITVTDRLVQCGKLMDIPLHDHIIVGNPSSYGYYSMQKKGLIDDNRPEQMVKAVTSIESLSFELPLVAEPDGPAMRRGRTR